MRLIDADDLAAKIMIDAPDFMGSGSSITKAYILAMVKTRSATPTVDAIPVVRCKDCIFGKKRKNNNTGMEWIYCQHHMENRPTEWFCASGERLEKLE